MIPQNDLRAAEVFVAAAERAIDRGDADAALALARHAQHRLVAAQAPAGGRADREADVTAAYYKRMLS